MRKVLFICMPFASASWGSLALGTLKSICRDNGIEADVRYLNIPFANSLGEARYNNLRELIHAEICFTPALFDDVSTPALWEQFLASSDGVHGSDPRALAESEKDFTEIITRHVPALFKTAMSEIEWDDYDIVGFTTGYRQTIASLALAQLIRRNFPEKIIIFGGAACDGEMGPALLKNFEMLDVVVSGEADLLIAPLIKALRRREAVGQWPGVYIRSSNRVVANPPTPLTIHRQSQASLTESGGNGKVQMDALPVPDYDDYFEQLEGVQLEDTVRVPFESSRGCWWGQKHLCSFCGLNGTSLAYRAKSPDKVIAEIEALYLRYGQTSFMAADNIFDMTYFKTFLPKLKSLRERFGIKIFYETKSNLREDQIRALSESGVVEVQPGIESFSDHVLKLMDKGTTGLNQVRFLRDCASHGVETRYGILWGNPGETTEDYTRMADLIPYVRHLPPPNYIAPVSLERFSPYFMTPDKYGIRNVRPAPIYPVMFGGRPLDYEHLAYVFCYDHDSDRDSKLNRARTRFWDAAFDWRDNFQPQSLVSSELNEMLYISDRRNGEVKLLRLTGLEKAVLTFCNQPHNILEIKRVLPDATTDWLQQLLDVLVDRRLMLAWNTEPHVRYLSLPVHTSTNSMYEIISKVKSEAGVEA
jgi:ribosomal peptide maturation radical SAM protein 1